MKVFVALIFLLAFKAHSVEEYGKKFPVPRGGMAPTVSEAIKELQDSKAKKLLDAVVQGEIAQVCQSKGCWITLKNPGAKEEVQSCEEAVRAASQQAQVRVMFDHKFSVPKDLKGLVFVRGNLEKVKLSSFQLKHLLKDAKCSKKQIKKAKGSIYKYQMKAIGVQKA